MADVVKELVIRIKRDDAQALASQRAYHAAQKKAIQQNLTDAEVAEKARTELIKRENRQRIQEAAKATKTTVEQTKQAEVQKTEAAKKAAKEILASTRQQIAESKRLERELFNEGKRLAAEAAARESRDARNAVEHAKLVFTEKKKQLDAQKRATDDAAAATRQMTRAMLGTQVAGAALNFVRQGIDAVAQSAADARSRIQAMNEAAASARFNDREIAALTGNKATVAFSASQAGEAAQAGVSPEEYRKAQIAFQAQAGQFIGTGDLSKISEDDARDLMQRVVSFSASQGIESADPARLMGSIIGKGDKNDSNSSRLATFGKLFKAIQLAPGEASPLIGQLTELIQEEVGDGGSFDDVLQAVPLIRAMAERNPGEASTYGRSLIRGLREINMDPEKMSELGITKGMSFMEQMQAVDKSAAAVGAAGGDEGEFLSKYFRDIRQFGAVRTALSSGIRGKGFDRVQAEMAGVNEATVNADVFDYRNSEEGRAQAAASRETQADLEQAANPGMILLQEARARARASLKSSGELNQGEGFLGSIFTSLGQARSQGDRALQEETSLVGSELRQRLSGFPAGREFLDKQDSVLGGALMNPFANGVGTRGASESLLAEGFKVLAEFRAATQSMQAAGEAIKTAKPPVPAPAPAKPPVVGRVGG